MKKNIEYQTWVKRSFFIGYAVFRDKNAIFAV